MRPAAAGTARLGPHEPHWDDRVSVRAWPGGGPAAGSSSTSPRSTWVTMWSCLTSRAGVENACRECQPPARSRWLLTGCAKWSPRPPSASTVQSSAPSTPARGLGTSGSCALGSDRRGVRSGSRPLGAAGHARGSGHREHPALRSGAPGTGAALGGRRAGPARAVRRAASPRLGLPVSTGRSSRLRRG